MSEFVGIIDESVKMSLHDYMAVARHIPCMCIYPCIYPRHPVGV